MGAQVGVADGGFVQVERRALLRQLLQDLDPRDAKVVRLRYLHDLGQADIAERVGISQPMVSRILQRSMTQLRNKVGPAGEQAATRGPATDVRGVCLGDRSAG